MKFYNIRKKKTARQLSIRRRHTAIDSNDQVYGRKLEKLIKALIVKASIEIDMEEKVKILRMIKLLSIKYFQLTFETYQPLPRPLRWVVSIDSFSGDECWNFFTTRKGDLWRLCTALRFPESIVLNNGSRMPGEEVFLRGLYELVSGENQFNIATNVFGRDQSQQSRAFNFFIEHVFSSFHDLLYDRLDWWFEKGYLKESCDAITAKLYDVGLQFDENTGPQSVGMFIDCNCMEVCRVAGGPRSDGPDAERWECNLQRAFYNGWKSIHGLKHQTVDIAHGFTVSMYGPTSVRRNDLKLLGLSQVRLLFVRYSYNMYV